MNRMGWTLDRHKRLVSYHRIAWANASKIYIYGLFQFLLTLLGIAFAAIKEGGSVVAWGDPTSGGDCSNVLEKLLTGTERIFSTAYAFAAIMKTGEVVTWGDAASGGDSSLVTEQVILQSI